MAQQQPVVGVVAHAQGAEGLPVAARVTLASENERQRLDAAATREKMLSTLQMLPTIIKAKNAHSFFKVTESKDRSQQVRVTCLACDISFASTGSSRLTKHILQCVLMPSEVKAPFKALSEKTASNQVEKRARDNLCAEEAQIAAAAHAAKQARLVQQKVRAGFKTLEVAEADAAIANFFYANGLAFSAAATEQDSYYRAMIKKIQAAPQGYIPPNRKKIAGPLLDDCYDDMWKKIDARDPGGLRALQYGSCYISDGWDSCDNLPLINSAFITANDGGVYWRSVDTSGNLKNAEYCAALMIADIYAFVSRSVHTW